MEHRQLRNTTQHYQQPLNVSRSNDTSCHTLFCQHQLAALILDYWYMYMTTIVVGGHQETTCIVFNHQ